MDLIQLNIEDRGEVVVARVSGELDIAGATSTGEAIQEAVPTSARALVVDFSELDFIDSSGIAMRFGWRAGSATAARSYAWSRATASPWRGCSRSLSSTARRPCTRRSPRPWRASRPAPGLARR